MFSKINTGDKSPQTVNAIIEIPQKTSNKYEYDEKLGVIKLDRVLHSPFYYPVDYGFIAATRSSDGDNLDVMVLTDAPTFPGCLMEVRPIGLFIMSDESGDDEKVLAVPAKNPRYNHIENISDVPEHLLKEISHFFSEYKKLEKNKTSNVKGWGSREEAYALIERDMKVYQDEQK